MSLILYSTSACHLCELALEVIKPVLFDPSLIREVDISDSDELIESYGMRIPVLKDSVSGLCLDWPFDQAQLIAFLQHLEQLE